MFVLSTEACSMPNSESPMPQSAIDEQNAFVSSVATAFDDGDSALNDLITTLGGNPAGQTVTGAAGVPTTGTVDLDTAGIPVVPFPSNAPPMSILWPEITDPSSWAWSPSPADPNEWANSPGAPQIVPGGGSGYRAPQGEQALGNRRRYRNVPTGGRTGARSTVAGGGLSPLPANCPIIIPLVTTIPVQTQAPVVAPTPAPVTAPAPVVIPVPAALPDCRTGNWCMDIMNGCVLASQVSAAQLQACTAAGYAGNRNLYPAIAAAGGAEGGEYFGTPDPNPPPFTGLGMAGFGQDDSAAVAAANAGVFSNAIESVITGLVAAAALGIFLKGRKKS